jgi:putative phage-type endonuclease
MDRTKGIGGSDAAAACGLDPYRTPMQLYAEKRGETPGRTTSIPMMVGTLLDPLVVDLAERELGEPITRRQEVVYDPERPFLWATLDGATRNAVVQAKTTSMATDWGDPGTDEIPVQYLIQVQHEMRVTGLGLAIVPVLFLGRELQIYKVEADHELQKMVLERELELWDRIQRGDPPDPQRAIDAVLRWPKDSGAKVTATPEVERLVRDLREARAAIKELEEEKISLEDQLKVYIADASTLVSRDGHQLATWKAQGVSRVDVKRLQAEAPEIAQRFTFTSSTRVLRLKK